MIVNVIVRELYSTGEVDKYSAFMSAHYALTSLVYGGMFAERYRENLYIASLSSGGATGSAEFFREITHRHTGNRIVSLRVAHMLLAWNTNADVAMSLSYYFADHVQMPRIKIVGGWFSMMSYATEIEIVARSIPEVIARYSMIDCTGLHLRESGNGDVDFNCVVRHNNVDYSMPMFSIGR